MISTAAIRRFFPWLPAVSLAFALIPGSAAPVVADDPANGTRLWDFRYPNRVAAHEMTMSDGVMLPDGSMAILAMGDEWRGSLGLYRLGRDGGFQSRQEFAGWHWWHIEQPNPAIVPVATGSSGFVVVGSHFGYARLPLTGPPLEHVTWIHAPFHMAGAVSAARDGSVWLGGTERPRLKSTRNCSRAVVDKFDSGDRRRWAWTFQYRAKTTFVHQLSPLADGSILAYVSSESPVGYGGGAITYECDDNSEHGWLARIASDGRTSWIADLGSDKIESFAVRPDGAIAIIGFAENRLNPWPLRLRILSGDGSRWLTDRRYEFDSRRLPSPGAVPVQLRDVGHPYSVEEFGVLSTGYFMAIHFDCRLCRFWSTHLLMLDSAGNIIAASPAWPSVSRFLIGIDPDGHSFTVGDQDGVFRLPLP